MKIIYNPAFIKNNEIFFIIITSIIVLLIILLFYLGIKEVKNNDNK